MKALIQESQDVLDLKISSAQLEMFQKYHAELVEWNEQMNLTAIRDPEGIRVKHFLDSLSCLQAMRNTPLKRLVDVGTGAGFPGIPIKLLYPEIHLTLVESIAKKTAFLEHIVQVLGLKGVEVLQTRAETLGQDAAHRESYDWAVARAVAPLPVLMEYLLPLVKIGGKMLAQKGESGPAEAHRAEKGLHLLGGHLCDLHKVELPGVAEERYLVVAKKVAATPDKYPRREGIPAKRPL
ncbi:MAG: 16S rRNA (guanine(527)-N(7))-methyltransferase RsmG [Anaerolineales bacterium]|nr:16S rRNA (guanine(527)-N(7))-methyltransferase RsmG [Anaerolineales bacterium]